MIGRVVSLVLAAAFVVVTSPGCSSSSSANVSEASCNACTGASYSDAECQSWGAAAGCESSTFVATVAGCNNGCSFKSCREPPTCKSAAKDAGAVDAAPDPRCAGNTTGLWSQNPPCANPGKVQINGATQYTCPCTGGCACGFKCGSIPLSVGGSIGSVCAP